MSVTVYPDQGNTWSEYLYSLPEGTQLMVDAAIFEKQDEFWNDWLQLNTGLRYELAIMTDSRFVHLCSQAQTVVFPLERFK